ncbi:MAG: putative DNA binding domain-containing protein [Prevotellaceae bacterium]|jgi:ATP-dependent DNA helicase RecG|nr:putative DNA binding domain-containing protein [Prevotellaceae bacterium]
MSKCNFLQVGKSWYLCFEKCQIENQPGLMMTTKDLHTKLEELRRSPENEIVEFKEAREYFNLTKLGTYFSALSNEANLLHKSAAWLILGIEDKNHYIIGTSFRKGSLPVLKKEIADKTTNRITFIDIYEITIEGKRVIMFQIPPAPKGIPIAFDGHYYGRDHESLVPLNIEEMERIRFQVNMFDWTQEIIPNATINDLDKDAISKARIEYRTRNPTHANEINTWDDAKFLNKAKLTIKGKITRTAFILLGKEEEEHFLDAAVKIRWNLKTIDNQDKDFEIFSIPFILAVDKVYQKIRNLKYRYLKDNSLFPEEVLRYDPYVIRESLNNAIAHQDYSKKARINVVEFENDQLVFSNYGTFLPKSIEDVVLKDTPEEIYRNPFLVEAMKNLGMIETQGGGIRKIFNYQRQRFFPMPEYDLRDGKVKSVITGKIINEDFAKILNKNPNLLLEDILILDKVQKHKNITEDEFRYLKKYKLIEGRKGRAYLSFNVIKPTENENLQAEYIANRSFDDTYFKKMIVEYVKKFGKVKRSTIDNLIIPKLSTALDEKQKKNKVTNYLSALRKEQCIKSTGYGTWEFLNEF